MQVKRKNKCVEFGIQKAFFQWLSYYPAIRRVTFAIPNGGKRTPAEGAHQRALGLTAGIPDIFMAIPSDGFNGMFIELKRPSGILTENQAQTIEWLGSEGYKCVICYSVTEAIDQVKDYLKDKMHVRCRSAQAVNY